MKPSEKKNRYIFLIHSLGSLFGCLIYLAIIGGVVMAIFSLIGCLRHECDGQAENNIYRFQSFPVQVNNVDNTFERVDTLKFSFTLDQIQYDTFSGTDIFLDGGLLLNFEVTTIEPLPNGPPSTIVEVFDQYFETLLPLGTQVETYRFLPELVGEQWRLELWLVPRRSGEYYARVSVHDLFISEHPDYFCLLGGDFYNNIRIHFEVDNDQTPTIFPQTLDRAFFDDYAFVVN